jgi:uncharacterized membrane protein
MSTMDPQGLNRTTPRFNTRRRIPQLIPHRLLRDSQIHHPAVLEEAKRRSENFPTRLADRITTSAGSMNFVFIHVVFFAVWIALLETYRGRYWLWWCHSKRSCCRRSS